MQLIVTAWQPATCNQLSILPRLQTEGCSKSFWICEKFMLLAFYNLVAGIMKYARKKHSCLFFLATTYPLCRISGNIYGGLGSGSVSGSGGGIFCMQKRKSKSGRDHKPNADEPTKVDKTSQPSVSQPVRQFVSQSVSQFVSWPLSRSAGVATKSWPDSLSVSESVNRTINHMEWQQCRLKSKAPGQDRIALSHQGYPTRTKITVSLGIRHI